MPEPSPAHTDRRRAESFGVAAEQYDRHRPRYPESLIAGLVTSANMRVLDVGAGTGIAAMQLAGAGAQVLAVEPDGRMARLAASKGIRVEQSTFEEWQPAGRDFDLVVFAQSFHWVETRPALEKVAAILRPGGRLAILANRIHPTSPTQQDLDEINAQYVDVSAKRDINAEEEVVIRLIEECGFSVELHSVDERLHYTTEGYLNLVSTYSNRLLLDPAAQDELRSRLAERIGSGGVDARNAALAVICTPAGCLRTST
jgi:SAM-dependent methyltransferase